MTWYMFPCKVGQEYGLNPGEMFDENPQRYFEYSTFDPKLGTINHSEWRIMVGT